MRLKNHRSKSKDPVRQKTPLYIYFNRIGWINARIELLVEFENITNIELLEIEKTEITASLSDSNCLNKATPLRTPEEKKQRDKEYGKVYLQEHLDHIREKTRQWRLDNPEKYAEQRRRANERGKEKRSAQKKQSNRLTK